MASLLSPFPKWITGMSLTCAKRCTSRTYASPIFPNAADDGIGNPHCQRRNWHTQPTVCSFGTYACRKIRSTERHMSVT